MVLGAGVGKMLEEDVEEWFLRGEKGWMEGGFVGWLDSVVLTPVPMVDDLIGGGLNCFITFLIIFVLYVKMVYLSYEEKPYKTYNKLNSNMNVEI